MRLWRERRPIETCTSYTIAFEYTKVSLDYNRRHIYIDIMLCRFIFGCLWCMSRARVWRHSSRVLTFRGRHTHTQTNASFISIHSNIRFLRFSSAGKKKCWFEFVTHWHRWREGEGEREEHKMLTKQESGSMHLPNVFSSSFSFRFRFFYSLKSRGGNIIIIIIIELVCKCHEEVSMDDGTIESSNNEPSVA